LKDFHDLNDFQYKQIRAQFTQPEGPYGVYQNNEDEQKFGIFVEVSEPVEAEVRPVQPVQPVRPAWYKDGRVYKTMAATAVATTAGLGYGAYKFRTFRRNQKQLPADPQSELRVATATAMTSRAGEYPAEVLSAHMRRGSYGSGDQETGLSFWSG